LIQSIPSIASVPLRPKSLWHSISRRIIASYIDYFIYRGSQSRLVSPWMLAVFRTDDIDEHGSPTASGGVCRRSPDPNVSWIKDDDIGKHSVVNEPRWSRRYSSRARRLSSAPLRQRDHLFVAGIFSETRANSVSPRMRIRFKETPSGACALIRAE